MNRTPLLASLLGIGLTAALFVVLARQEERRDDAEFHRQVTSYLGSLQERRNGSEDILRTLRALFFQNPKLDRQLFTNAVEDLAIRMDGMQAIGWAPRVTAAARAAFEQAVRQEGFADFQIVEGDLTHQPEERPVRAAMRSEYFPLLFIEPFAGNELALGYDLASPPSVQDLLSRTHREGGAEVSGPLRIPYKQRVRIGVLAAMPVYFPDFVPASQQARLDQNQGYVVAVFIIDELMRAIAERAPDLQLDVMLLDETQPGSNTVMGITLQGKALPKANWINLQQFRRPGHFAQQLKIGGRNLVLDFRRSSGWNRGLSHWVPMGVLGTGLLLTAILGMAINASGQRARHIEAMVDLRTAELAQANAKLKRDEADKLEFARRLQETQKLESLGILAGGIAHDFNNLLTVILGNANLARLEVPDSAKARQFIGRIETTALRAAELCKQMLAYSGKGIFVVRRLDLSQLVEQTTELLQLSISKKVRLQLDLARGLPPILADATQLQQILMNLVINASDAIGTGEGLIQLRSGLIRVDQAALRTFSPATDILEGEYVFLEVSDNGSGMSPEVRDKIFDPFFSTKFTGRGLGLAAVLGIVRGHRGAITVQSEPGKGSTFRLLLPPTQGPIDEIPRPATSKIQSKGQETILLAEDEEAVRITTAGLLTAGGFAVELAENGHVALQKFQARPDRYQAVLLDLTMANGDGEETFREIRRIRPDARVLMMSGFSPQAVLDRFAGQGLNGFIQKPFLAEELLRAIRKILDDSSPGVS